MEAWLFRSEAKPPGSETCGHAASWAAQPVGLSFTDHPAPLLSTSCWVLIVQRKGLQLRTNCFPLISSHWLSLNWGLNVFLAPKVRDNLRAACPAHVTTLLWELPTVVEPPETMFAGWPHPSGYHWFGPIETPDPSWANQIFPLKVGVRVLIPSKPYCPFCPWVL